MSWPAVVTATAAHCGGKGVCGRDDGAGLLETRRPPTGSPAGPKCSSVSSEIELAESRESFLSSSSSSASFCFRFSPAIPVASALSVFFFSFHLLFQ